MPVFTAIAAGVTALATAAGFAAATAAVIGGVAAFAARTLLTIGISKLLSNRKDTAGVAGAQDAGARIQLPPSTDNKLPVIYGSAFIAPVITDAKISTDQKTMWYVCALSEVTDTGTLTFGNIYYDGKLCTFDGTDTTKVVSLTNNTTPEQVDTKVSGNLYMYLYNNGSLSPTNTTQTAIEVLQDAGIPIDAQWTSSDLMSDCAFVIVKVIYNQDAGTTNLGQLSVQLQNSLNEPGAVIYDYLTNIRYGCAIPVESIDTTSLLNLTIYSNQLIEYIPVGGGTATQPRYRINGPINTGTNCLNNLQQLVDSCDSWLQYSELTAEWKVVMNMSYEQAGLDLADLYHADSSVIIGGVEVNPIDLNSTYNSLEVQYPNANIKDQTDFRVILLEDYKPSIMSPNEPDNRLVCQFPQVNNYVQAVYLGVRRLLQSREDLIINLSLDYSGIQVGAGDVIRVTHAEYGWDNKLFRVSQVQEVKTGDGTLGAQITAFEYNSTVYDDNAIQNFVPEANTGLSDPNIISKPGTPTATVNPLTDGNIKSFTIASTVPATGSVLYMDFNFGLTSDVETHILYRTVSTGNGVPYVAGNTVSIISNDLVADTYYFSVTARNNQAGRTSDSSLAFVWDGMGVTVWDPALDIGGVYNDNIADSAVSTNKLIVGSVTQARSTTSDTEVLPVPFYNWPTLPKTWPDNTRAIMPAGGVTLIPSTNPTDNTDTEIIEGSRIQVNFTVKLYTASASEYNLVELWKSGASDLYNRGFNTVRHSYNTSSTTTGRTQTIHAYGYGAYDLYSSDGGLTWGTWAANTTTGTISGAVNLSTANTASSLTTYTVGMLQDISPYGLVSAGTRAGNTGSGSYLDLDQNLNPGGVSAYHDLTGVEFVPGTGTNGFSTTNNTEMIAVGESGVIVWTPTDNLFNTASVQESTGGTLQSLYSVYANQLNGSTYTAIAVGSTGTILRALRTLNNSTTWSSRPTTLTSGKALLTPLYSVAGDDTTQAGTSKWVAVGDYGMIQVSVDDGDEWVQVAAPTGITSSLNAVRYCNGTWVIVGDKGIILTATDPLGTWTQINDTLTTRNLFTIDYSYQYDTINVGGQSMLLNSPGTTISFTITLSDSAAETYDLTRIAYFGSWPEVNTVTLPPASQRINNNQVFSATYNDTTYVKDQETTYYLVIGNMAGSTVYTGQVYLNATEYKR